MFTKENIEACFKHYPEFIKIGGKILIHGNYGYRPTKYYRYIHKDMEEKDSQTQSQVINDICSVIKDIKSIREYEYTHTWDEYAERTGMLIEFTLDGWWIQ